MNKIKSLFLQFGKFGIVGVISFLVDYFLLIALTEFAGWEYIVSSGISYTTSIIVNYILSMKFVFQSREDISKTKEVIGIFVLSAIGLGLNQMIMLILVESLHVFYALAKILSTLIVSLYNFLSRKMFLETSDDDDDE